MKVYYNLEEIVKTNIPYAISIGMFDGVHHGHRHLLDCLKKTGKKTCVITFANHPLDIIHPENSPKLITSLEKKLERIGKAKIDVAVVLPFTQKLKMMDAKEFLTLLEDHFCIEDLVLGKGATFGWDKKNFLKMLFSFMERKNGKVHFVELLKDNQEIISSSLIRSFLEKNEKQKALSYLQ